MKQLQKIITGVERPDLLSKDIHWQGGSKNSNCHTSTYDEHALGTIVCNPVVEKVRKSKKHEILECGGSDKRLHGNRSVGIEHVCETSVHIDQQCTDSEAVKHGADDVSLSGIDSETESVETDSGQDEGRGSKE